jgi:hypothetical protein
MFFIKVPSLKPSLPTTFMLATAFSKASTVLNDQDFMARSDINLNLLLSLIQYVPVSVFTASPDGIIVGLLIKAV